MKIGLTPIVDKHFGVGFESYKMVYELKNIGRVFQKSLTDNSKVYDLQLFDDGGTSDDIDISDYIIISVENLAHGKRILKTILNNK